MRLEAAGPINDSFGAPHMARRRVGAPYLDVIVPAYNEEERLELSLSEFAAYLRQQSYSAVITVVDNGSADRTLDVAIDARRFGIPVRIVGCAERGKGAAVRRGALATNARFVGFADADHSTPIETLDRVVPLLESGHEVVIASRRCPGASYETKQPLKRRMAGYAFRSVARACVAQIASVSDTQCGFKFFDARAAKKLFRVSQATGFGFDVEILALAELAGLTVTEVPTKWRDAGGSTLSMLEEANAILSDLFTARRTVDHAAPDLVRDRRLVNSRPRLGSHRDRHQDKERPVAA